MTTTLHLPPQWRERLLYVVAGKVNVENLRFLLAMQRAEGGDAQWNPLNTTYYLSGATAYNDNVPPVRNYRYPIEGIVATALTLTGRDSGALRYPGLLGDFQSGIKSAEAIAFDRAAEIRKWGTNPDLIMQILNEV